MRGKDEQQLDVFSFMLGPTYQDYVALAFM
jgi:hypothetical protein